MTEMTKMNEIQEILHLLINNLQTTVYNKKANIYLLNVDKNIHYRLKRNKLALFSFTSNYIKKWQSKNFIKIDKNCKPFSSFSQLVLYFISLLNSSFVIIIENNLFSRLLKNIFNNFFTVNFDNYIEIANEIIKTCKLQNYNFIDFYNISSSISQPTMKISTLFLDNVNTINEFRFNPSILHLSRDLFLCSYRFIKYDTDISTFPWTVWWDGTKYFRDKYPELVDKKKFFDFRFELPTSLDEFEIDITINPFIDIQNIPEYDSTGIALLKYNETNREFTIVYQNDVCFIKNIFSQDARLQKVVVVNNISQIVITYNRFIIDHNTNKYRIIMCCRNINLFDTKIHFGREQEMLPNYNSLCEKNITFMPNNDILFSINDTFDIIPFITNNSNLFKTNFPKINMTKQAYSQQIYFSLSTPAVLFKESGSSQQYIMVGHCKLPTTIFTKYVDLSLIYKKNMNTVYTMFIVVFDNNYNILKSSPLFIPTSVNNIHNPFLLTFPTGIYYDNGDHDNDLIISYGEGDCKCKILHLSSNDLEQLFSIDANNSIFSVGYYFDSKFKMIFDHNSYTRLVYNKINIFGYYHHHNTGDDGFMIVFKQLFKKYNILLEFFNPDDSLSVCDFLIVGGGNVVNSYFFNIVGYFREYHPSTPVFAVGVEIPFIQNTHFLSMVDYCFTRNESDLINIPLDSDKKQYMPDLLFALDTVYWSDQIEETFNIGVFLAQPYINKNYPTEGAIFINNIVETLCQLYNKKFVGNKRIKFFLIPFGIDPNSETENDYIICNQVIDGCLYMGCDENFFTLVNINIHNNVHDTVNQMKIMDFNICSRYHAHVFSIINNTLFVSISTQKKCKNLMAEFNLNDYIVDILVNDENVPISFNTNLVIDIFENLFSNTNNNNNNNLVTTLKTNMQTIYKIKKTTICDLFYTFFDPLILSPPDNTIGQGGCSHSNSCINI